MAETTNEKQRIAVLGGGCGSMSAVWALTQLPNWQERFDITVYQLGWRLGGKCASGRNGEYGQRIQEHGLHVWAGFYENGFRLMQECYGEAAPAPDNPIKTWEDAFRKHSAVILEEFIDGEWKHWPLTFPENDAVPGTGGVFPTIWQYLELLLDWLLEQLKGVATDTTAEAPQGTLSQAMIEHLGSGTDTGPKSVGLWSRLRGETPGTESQESTTPAPDLSNYSAVDTLTAAHHLSRALGPDANQHHAIDHHRLLHLVEQGIARFEKQAEDQGVLSDDWRRLRLMVNFCHATVRGLLLDGVVFRGFEAINDIEWTAWLARNGARQSTLDSAVVRGIYDYVFGFFHGRSDDPRIEAGTATHGMLRLFFTYKGALFWEMQAGMGDIVFAPLYTVLKSKGVNFEFFHKVEQVKVSKDGNWVEAIDLTRQATVKEGDYQPLIKVKGVPAWPASPHYGQLVEGEELKEEKIDLESAWSPWKGVEQLELRVGRDFDQVILGMSMAAIDVACQELKSANEKFANMVDHVKTVQTGAMQLWLDADAEALKAPVPPRITSAYAQDLNTWSDMSFLLPREDWPEQGAPRYLAYFCGEFPDAEEIPPFSDHAFPAEELARFRTSTIEWLNQNVGHIWPGATREDDPNGLNWDLLHDPDAGSGTQRLDAQYLRVNIDPSERYVLSLPNTSRYRLRGGESGFENLFLAGDWVRTSINAGCVEAAVMAGLDAASALSGDPIQIIGGLKK